MAVTTKTFTENYYGTHQAAWTINYNRSDIIVTGATFRIKPLTITAKYVASGKNRGSVDLDYDALIGDALVGAFAAVYPSNYMVTGNTYTIPSTDAIGDDKQTSDYFKASNKTSKTIALKYQSNSIDVASWRNATDDWWNGWTTSTQGLIGTVNIVLDAPPNVTIGTPTYSSPQYAGLGSYSVPLTTLAAQYGGDITKVTLTVGTDSTVQTYSAQTVSGQTISVTPSVAGSFTPVLTVEDSRGQVTARTLTAITVNGYNAPSVGFDVFRTNSSGVRDDEGTFGLIEATVTFTDAVATITQPAVTINGTTTNSVTWYSTYNSGTGVSGTISDWTTVDNGDTIYGLINGSFSTASSYVIGVTVTDSEGESSSEITQTLSTAFYTIDFQAGGKEIAFGAPANDNLGSYPDGLFKCNMDAQFDSGVALNSTVNFGSPATVLSNLGINDYIVASGTNSNWTWRKWKGGWWEAWYSGSVTLTSDGQLSSYNPTWYRSHYSVTVPSASIGTTVTIYGANCSSTSPASFVMQGYTSLSSSTITQYLVKGGSAHTGSVTAYVYAYGTYT